jgi:hypothetical protein
MDPLSDPDACHRLLKRSFASVEKNVVLYENRISVVTKDRPRIAGELGSRPPIFKTIDRGGAASCFNVSLEDGQLMTK